MEDYANLTLYIMSDHGTETATPYLRILNRTENCQVAYLQFGIRTGPQPLRRGFWANIVSAAAIALILAACSDPAQRGNADEKQAVAVAIDINRPAPVKIIQAGPSLSGNYLAGIHARAQNDSAAGVIFMDQVLAADPKNTSVLLSAFLFKLQDGAVADALPLARQLQKVQQDNQLVALSLISDAFKRRDFAQAKTLIATLDKQGLGALLQPLLGAWAEAGLGNMDIALASLEPLSQRNSFQPFYAFHRALMASVAKRDDLAEQYFTELLGENGSRSIRAALAFGTYLETRNQYPRAAEIYRSLVQPVQPHPLLTAALARNAAKQPANLLVNDPAAGAAEVLYGVSSVLSQESAPNPLPLIYLRLAIYINPDSEEARILLAGMLEGLGRYDDAIAMYAGVPESSPHFESARIQMAQNEDRAGRAEAAIEGLRQYIAKYPGRSGQAQISLADTLRNHERYDEAVTEYDKVIAGLGAPKPYHWPMLYARGMTLERAGNWPHAERDLLHALELEPDQPNVLNYLAYSWIDKGLNIQRAKTMIESAAKQRPEDGAIIDSLGWIQYRIGEYSNAVETLENAISLLPQDAVINDHLGDAYWQVGRRLEAQFQWQRALSFDPEPEIRRVIEKKLQYGLDSSPTQSQPAVPSAQKS